MVDIDFIRENPDLIKKAVIDKGLDLNVDQLLKVDEKRRELIRQVDELRQKRNEAAKARDIEKGKKVKIELVGLEENLKVIERDFNELMVKVPTVPAADTPPGKSDVDNIEVFRNEQALFCGKKDLPRFDFKAKDHIEIGKNLDILDLERGAKVSGYRGYYIKNEGVMLMMALMMYTLRKVIAKGYQPMIPPTLVKEFALFGSGYFKGLKYDPEVDEIYQIATSDKEASGNLSKDKKFLVGTAEPSLLAYFSGETLKNDQLPLRMCGFSQCYRSEIGSYGKDTKGHYRVHEFMKVEMVSITHADIKESDNLQQEMIEIAKEILEELGLPFRVIRICIGDLSVGKYKQFDLETWLPGMERWAETGSASNFLDWQANRLDINYIENNQKHRAYLLNATALPTPRPFIAILENFQQKDGSVKIPEVLIPYTGFSEIKPK